MSAFRRNMIIRVLLIGLLFWFGGVGIICAEAPGGKALGGMDMDFLLRVVTVTISSLALLFVALSMGEKKFRSSRKERG